MMFLMYMYIYVYMPLHKYVLLNSSINLIFRINLRRTFEQQLKLNLCKLIYLIIFRFFRFFNDCDEGNIILIAVDLPTLIRKSVSSPQQVEKAYLTSHISGITQRLKLHFLLS